MDLASQVESILKYEGLKPKTREAALRETFAYYQQFQQRMIEHAKENQSKEKHFSESHLPCLEAAQSLLKNVMKGKTTYQREWEKVEKDPEKGIKRRQRYPQYRIFERIFTIYTFSGFFDEIDRQTKLLDETIQHLYLNKPKKKRDRGPELWRNIL